MVELKAKMLYACGFSRTEIEKILGHKLPAEVSLPRALQQQVSDNVTARVADQIITANTSIILEIKNAEVEEYRRVMDALKSVDVMILSAEDKLRHAKTLLAVQKYIYTTCQVNMEDRSKKKTYEVDINNYLVTPKEGQNKKN